MKMHVGIRRYAQTALDRYAVDLLILSRILMWGVHCMRCRLNIKRPKHTTLGQV